MWDRIEPIRPDGGLPRVPSVRRLPREKRRSEDEGQERDGRGRRDGGDEPPDAESGHVDVRV